MSDQQLIASTIQVWQPYYEQELTKRDGEEIIANWSAYVDFLAEWVLTLQRKLDKKN